ncbi:MAG TPA: MFS transporter [Rhizomicrobium sp.]|nr:MFS transporter [Rhizomicrobium sp.]
MAYFRNSAINFLNLHYGIFSFAMTGAGAFNCVYLFKAGVPLPYVMATMGGILLVRFVIRPAIVPLAVRFGLQKLVIAGTFLIALQFPIIAAVHGVGFALYALIVVAAIGDTVYWSSYHAFFAALGDKEDRGQQIGAREALAAIAGIVSPLLTGWLLVTYGALAAFGMTSVVMATAFLPLLKTPNITIAPHVPGAWKASLPGVLLFMGDGWIAGVYVFLWQIALFISLGQNFLGYGGAMAAAALAGAVGGLLLGRHIDAGHGVRAVWIALGGMVLVVVLRAASISHPAFAVAANALGALEMCLYVPALMAAVYNQAKHSPCTLRFHVATEGGWDIGGASACFFAALLTGFAVPLWLCLLLPLLGVAALFVMLRRYYAASTLAINSSITVPVADPAAMRASALDISVTPQSAD